MCEILSFPTNIRQCPNLKLRPSLSTTKTRTATNNKFLKISSPPLQKVHLKPCSLTKTKNLKFMTIFLLTPISKKLPIMPKPKASPKSNIRRPMKKGNPAASILAFQIWKTPNMSPNSLTLILSTKPNKWLNSSNLNILISIKTLLSKCFTKNVSPKISRPNRLKPSMKKTILIISTK